jgi:peptidoglycan/LPS O-acetylase OafA/YrhL
MVMAFHLGGVPGVGAYAVFGFYCLSGYLMTFIMQINYGYTTNGLTKYAVNRFLRIYPVYWVSILVSAVLIFRLGNNFTSNYHRCIYLPGDLLELARNLLLFFPHMELPRLTPPAWALTVEIFFYILIGLGLSKNKRITITWFAFSIIYHMAALILQFGWKHRYFTVPAASLPFATGALFFHYKDEMVKYIIRLTGEVYHYLPYILIFAILVNWGIGYLTDRSTGIFFYSNYLFCMFMVAILSDRKELPGISRKFDKLVGNLSYPIYLIHYQVGIVVIALLAVSGIKLKRPDLMLMSASIPVTIVCAWVMTITLERPIELIRSKVKR